MLSDIRQSFTANLAVTKLHSHCIC